MAVTSRTPDHSPIIFYVIHEQHFLNTSVSLFLSSLIPWPGCQLHENILLSSTLFPAWSPLSRIGLNAEQALSQPLRHWIEVGF